MGFFIYHGRELSVFTGKQANPKPAVSLNSERKKTRFVIPVILIWDFSIINISCENRLSPELINLNNYI